MCLNLTNGLQYAHYVRVLVRSENNRTCSPYYYWQCCFVYGTELDKRIINLSLDDRKRRKAWKREEQASRQEGNETHAKQDERACINEYCLACGYEKQVRLHKREARSYAKAHTHTHDNLQTSGTVSPPISLQPCNLSIYQKTNCPN